MRTLAIWSTVLILATAVNAMAAEPKLETEEQKTLYALGLTINRSLSPFNLSPSELALVEAGLADGSLHRTPAVDLETYGPKIKQLQETRAAAVAAAEKKTSQAFIDKAAQETGAMKTASGLVMIPVTPGTGASPRTTDTVTVSYEGTQRRHGLRQLREAWRARDGAAERGDQVLDRSPPTREGGRQEPARLPRRPCVRRPGLAPAHQAGRDPRLRGRAAGDLAAIGSEGTAG